MVPTLRPAEEWSKERPQWNMSSSVKEIPLEGETRSTNMELIDFLRYYVGGRAAVDEGYNVTMEVFVQEPDAYVQDQKLLRMIFNLIEYQVYKLHHEGVVSLEEWRDYERKDTVTSFARRKINRVLTQVLSEERREAETRVEREKQVQLTVTTTIKDALFRGRVRITEIKLNDFLTMELYGKGILRANRNVILREFFEYPRKYIRNKGVLRKIQAAGRYVSMETAVKEERDLEEDVRRLHEIGVHTLLGWSKAAAAVKAGVQYFTKNSLDAAHEELRRQTTEAAIILEGLYESVYNARWHHVVELPDGEKQKTGTGMDVREGEPPHSWTYKKLGGILEKDDGVEQSGAAPPRLMVLTSDKGWPYTLNASQGPMKD
ncbi:retrotransposon hot spot (RHS) protein, putative, partial [Trypanosoma cruzi marinkellei]